MKSLIWSILFPSIILAQKPLNSKDFFPKVNSDKTEQIQTVKITDKDTIEYVTHKYFFEKEGKKSYLISTTHDSGNLITSYLKEEITKKGLKYTSGKNYIYDNSNNQIIYDVKGKKKVTFPFKELSKLASWNVKTKKSYDNKVIITSRVSYIGLEKLDFNKKKVEALKFKRSVQITYKKEYKKEKVEYEYLWYFVKGLGMFKYTKIGSEPFEGIIIKSQ